VLPYKKKEKITMGEKFKKSLLVALIIGMFVIAGVNFYNAVTGGDMSGFEMLFLCMETYVFIFSTYYFILTFFGWKKYKKRYPDAKPKTKFAVIVPGHNEEKVISGIVKNLNKDMNYPRELFEVFVIADNCTDKTASIAREFGANVFENTTPKGAPKGKPYAIKAFLENNPDVFEDFDVLTIFDADNIVHFDYFNEVNSQFIANEDCDLIQCRVLSKNPDDNHISGGYSLSESFMNRFYTIPKQRFGINTTIQGTGFNVRLDYLKEVGWNPKSITEDFEFQVEMSNLNKKSQFNCDAKIYDEKPTTTKNSLVQRLRWSRGHWNVAFGNTFEIIKSIFTHRNLTALDTFFYSYNMSRTLLMGIGMLLSMLSLLNLIEIPLNIYNNIYISLFNIFYTLALVYTAYQEQVADKGVANLLHCLYSYLWFTVTYIPLHLISLMSFKCQTWKRTEKGINVSLEDRLQNTKR
jgi:cellulose synthase/poly-beta-1,6-N-acetylglucosamine synthase-like glycosyltransferase